MPIFDHIYGLNKLLSINPNVKVYTNEAGSKMLLNARKNLSFYHDKPFTFEFPEKIVTVNDGDEIVLPDEVTTKAIFTAGHNPSCIIWIIGDAIFTGDSYIPGVKTVTNLPKCDKMLAKQSEELILKLAEGKTIYPGHKI